MVYLFIMMLERLGIIVTIAFVLTRFSFFQDLIYQDKLRKNQQFVAIVFFGIFGIIGTYLGVAMNTETDAFNRMAVEISQEEAIANSRVIGIVIAGLLGGYKMGIGAGLIAGIHRFTLGGFTGFSCGLAAVAAGMIAGAFYKRNKKISLSLAFSVGALAEAVQMVLILLLARPFENAMHLVEIIGFPMVIANGVGSALFILITRNVVNDKEKVGALQAQKTFRIADQTLVHLRQGMNNKSTLAVCNILYKELQPSAVAITDKSNILAHVGLADDHHRANSPLQTDATKEVIQHGELVVADNDSIHCKNRNCPLIAAVIAPLKQNEQTVGTIKFYFQSEKEITSVILEVISGLSKLLSNQLELAEAQRAYQLAKEAEIKALQAQISPHFLFNSLNTVVSLIRIDPTKARRLLVSLSQFLRQNLSVTTKDMVSLKQELDHVKAYLTIEETRFVDRLKVDYEIDERVFAATIPPLTLQPLVENAIKHGFKNKDEDCFIFISMIDCGEKIKIIVADNGEGISRGRLRELGTEPMTSDTGTGLGLYNVNRRLRLIFGEDAKLHINSDSTGTEITFFIPKLEV
ncbi:sensor histidine kinase [Aquibacillus albus]|uniref:histidine kinase n=1 Tax=Aquibacillus albus TaxID=1168171 RepID=A0ABS2MVR8_9BACI|nr:sensor histidine kinase [Aquibacillus albus]MBM7569996.1 two-component system sensor histidine kinase LytS [Aquibacillus albus]